MRLIIRHACRRVCGEVQLFKHLSTVRLPCLNIITTSGHSGQSLLPINSKWSCFDTEKGCGIIKVLQSPCMRRFVEIGYRILLPFQLTLIYLKCVLPLPHLTVPRSVFDILGIWLVWYRHISRQNGSVRCHVSNSSNFDSMCTGLEYSLSINHTVPWYPTLLEVPSTDWYVVRTQCTWFRYSPWGINYWPLNGKQSTMSVYIYYNMSCQTRELDYCYTTLMTLC